MLQELGDEGENSLVKMVVPNNGCLVLCKETTASLYAAGFAAYILTQCMGNPSTSWTRTSLAGNLSKLSCVSCAWIAFRHSSKDVRSQCG